MNTEKDYGDMKKVICYPSNRNSRISIQSFQADNEFTLEIPEDSKILSVLTVGDDLKICAVVDESKPEEEIKIRVLLSNIEFNSKSLEFIQTITPPYKNSYHVFYVLN